MTFTIIEITYEIENSIYLVVLFYMYKALFENNIQTL
jgi:hypothetical protein